jgi:ketosteroid isomerase-like protein
MNRFLSCVLGSALLAPAAFAARPATSVAPTTPAVTTVPADPAAGIREVEAAVRAWAAAWSARDVTRYLAAYASDFTPPRGQDRKAWEADRRARIEEKAAISVEIDGLIISLKGQAATASFQQTYSADKLREKSRKTLELQRVEGRWLIRKEGAGG